MATEGTGADGVERLPAQAFDGDRLARPGTWAVAFVADWCPFCRRFRPEFEALPGPVGFRRGWGDVTDLESPLWDSFHLEVVPTVVAFRDGAVVFRIDGVAGVGLGPADLDALRQALTDPPARPG